MREAKERMKEGDKTRSMEEEFLVHMRLAFEENGIPVSGAMEAKTLHRKWKACRLACKYFDEHSGGCSRIEEL